MLSWIRRPWLALRDKLVAAGPTGTSAFIDDDGAVVLRLAGPRTDAIEWAIGRHGRRVHVVEQPAAPAVRMSGVYCGMYMQTAYDERKCTTGFLTTGGGWLVIIIVAHCVQNGSGPTAHWYTEGGYDNGGLIGVGTVLDPIPEREMGAILVSRISPHTYGPYLYQDGSLVHITRAMMPSRSKGPYLGTPRAKQALPLERRAAMSSTPVSARHFTDLQLLSLG